MSTRLANRATTKRKTTSSPRQIKSSPGLAMLVYLLATSFLLYEYVLQVSPSVITRELMYDFRLSQAWFGGVIAFYAYAYTAMQIPAGLLLDRFGPRRMLTLATLTCAVGALLFAMASGKLMLSSGRFLMGIGSAFAFTGPLMLIATWFPVHYFPVLAGIIQFASSIGAIVGQQCLVPFVKAWGWRTTTYYLGCIGLVLTLLIWLIVRDRPSTQLTNNLRSNYSWKQEIKKLRLVFKNPQTVWVGLYSFAVWAPIASFTGLWGVSFLSSAYNLSTQIASNALSLTWLGIGIGSPLLGWWSNSIKKYRLPLTVSALIGVVSWIVLLYGKLPIMWLYIDLFIIGLAASGQTLSFSVVKASNSPEMTGTVVGVNNTAVVASGAIFQPLLGYLLRWNQDALLVLPLCCLIAALTSQYYVKDTLKKSSVVARS